MGVCVRPGGARVCVCVFLTFVVVVEERKTLSHF